MRRHSGWDVTGRETAREFRALRFQQQVDTVGQVLRARFWHADAQVVNNPFGAYPFLHAQAHMPAYPGRVLLLSPIVSAFEQADKRMLFGPPLGISVTVVPGRGHMLGRDVVGPLLDRWLTSREGPVQAGERFRSLAMPFWLTTINLAGVLPHQSGDGAAHPIELPSTTLAALRILAMAQAMAAVRVMPSRPMTARSGAPNCRIQARSPCARAEPDPRL